MLEDHRQIPKLITMFEVDVDWKLREIRQGQKKNFLTAKIYLWLPKSATTYNAIAATLKSINHSGGLCPVEYETASHLP